MVLIGSMLAHHFLCQSPFLDTIASYKFTTDSFLVIDGHKGLHLSLLEVLLSLYEMVFLHTPAQNSAIVLAQRAKLYLYEQTEKEG